jgi:hypothetical protein
VTDCLTDFACLFWYSVNTFLVAFESLCHCSPDGALDTSGTLAGSPVLYRDEKLSLESCGLLDHIMKSDTEFLYQHCNARHLLRSVTHIIYHIHPPSFVASGKRCWTIFKLSDIILLLFLTEIL